jgi:hypothetical protein
MPLMKRFSVRCAHGCKWSSFYMLRGVNGASVRLRRRVVELHRVGNVPGCGSISTPHDMRRNGLSPLAVTWDQNSADGGVDVRVASAPVPPPGRDGIDDLTSGLAVSPRVQ